MERLKSYFLPILRSYSAVLFNSSFSGGGVLLLLTFLNPNLGLGGFVTVISAYLFARLIGFKREFLRLDYYIYNPLLVGLSLGYLFKISLLSLLFFAVAGVMTFLLTYALSSLFSYYLKLPVLSVPFVIGSSLLYLASVKFSNLFAVNLYPHGAPPFSFNLPLPLEGYLKSLGTIFFVPDSFAGFVISLVLLMVSRILFFLSLLGYFSGTLFQALLTGSTYHAFTDTSAFNYILTSMAVGGVFLIPSLRSYSFAFLSSLIAVPLSAGAKVFWESYGLPVFAIPFNISTHMLLYVLIAISYYSVVKIYKGTPERTLDYYLTYQKRFPFTGRELLPPFSGKWTVWQSFDGRWTHKGPWRYALDFVITDEEGKTYKGEGLYLTDYYAFGKPVLSPVDGEVVSVVSNIPDNPPGKANKENNWGNYVLIYDRRGFYVLLCHFKQNSIRVKPGEHVVKGTLLGLCGNSGYSPQPHIHLHVQLLPHLGAPTVPFNLASYLSGEFFYDCRVPEEGQEVEPVYPDKSLFNRFNLLIDQEMEFTVSELGKEFPLKLKVKMAPEGTFYLTDGLAKLYFGIENSTFYFYHFEGDSSSPLRYFFFSVPKIPLIGRQGIIWKDYLPLLTLSSKLRRELYLFLSSFKYDLFEVKVESSFTSSEKVSSDILLPGGEKEKACLLIAPDFGFEEICFGNKVTIRRKR
ncbi:urea transporter [Thermovibrio sp.]